MLMMERVKKLTKNIGCRHGQIFLLSVNCMIAFCISTSMSVSIVAMTDKKSANPNVKIFEWTSTQQSLILSSVLWGWVAFQVPIGILLQKLGGSQKLLCSGMLVSSVMMLLVPFLANNFGWIAVLVSRIIIGIGQGVLTPCSKVQIFNWAPLSERAQLGSLVLNAPQLGNVFAMLLSGILAATPVGWPSIYYIFGAIGVIWSLLYWWLGVESPAHHKSISVAEKVLIEKSLSQRSNEKKLPFPWKEVFRSPAVWSVLVADICNLWNYCILIAEIPSFMKYSLKFDIEQSGILSALPYMVKWLFTFPIGWASDFALRKGLPLSIIRKTCSCIGLWGPGLMLLILCFINSSEKSLSVTLMVMAVSLNAGNLCGQEINEIDIAPNFVGMLSSLIRIPGKIVGFLAPIAFGIIVSDLENTDQWHIIFYTSAAVYFLGNLAFVIFGKVEIQPWNGEMSSSTSS